MSARPEVSVVVSTYNRCELLAVAVEALLAQDAGGVPYEVVVVDNNSTDRTRETVESFVARGHANLRYVFEGRQGVSYGRNAGIAASRADIVAFTDDDIRPAPGWVASVRRAFDEHPEADFVGGKVLPLWEREPPAWLTREHWSPLALLDYGDEPFYVNSEHPLCLITANAAFRRAALEEIGLFSPDFQRVKHNVCSTEDHELLLRLWRAGRRGMYVPGVVVTAEVPASRMTKEFHRAWRRSHGRLFAMMRLEELERSSKGRLFDVPAPLYRQAAGDAAAWFRHSLRGRRGEAFTHAVRLHFFSGFFGQRRGEFRAAAGRGDLRELASFARAALGRVLGRGAAREGS